MELAFSLPRAERTGPFPRMESPREAHILLRGTPGGGGAVPADSARPSLSFFFKKEESL